MLKLLFLYTALVCLSVRAHAQDSTRLDKAISFPDKLFSCLNRKADKAQASLDHTTDKYLTRLQRREEKMRRRLMKKDSTAAKQIFGDIDQQYAALKSTSGKVSKYSALYSGHLDSLSTSLAFLKDQNLASNPELQKTLSGYKDLQQHLNATEQIKNQLKQREQLLKERFESLGMVKELRAYQKQLYYYQAQVKQLKETFEDPEKLEQRLITTLAKLPQFKSFFEKNSMLGSLFNLSGSDGISTTPLQGLQTRAMISQSLTNRFGAGAGVTQQLQQNLQSAQGQLNALKQKLTGYTSGSYGNSQGTDIPSFKPNNQKTKPFLHRLELGANMQSRKSNRYFPVTSDLGLSAGYKLNNKSVIGLGAAYKLGWGSGWSHIHLTHEGIGLRSYVDYQLKGSIYLSGGYELNHLSAFKNIDALKDYSAWQRSGLLGLSKKYSVSKKLKGQMKLLWDFLSYRQIPRTQAILFRIEYNIR